MLAKLVLLIIATYVVIVQPVSSDAPLANYPVQTNAAKHTDNTVHEKKDEKKDAMDLLNSAKADLLNAFLLPFVTANDYAQGIIKDFLKPKETSKGD